jgi:hypothetical protein
MTRPWGYTGPFGLRYGEPPRGGEHEVLHALGPEHMGKGHAVQFLDREGKMHGGQVTGWGNAGASVHVQNTGEGDITHQVPYHQIRSVTPASVTSSNLVKSAAGARLATDIRVGDEITLEIPSRRGPHRLLAVVRQVRAKGVDVQDGDGLYRREVPFRFVVAVKRGKPPAASIGPKPVEPEAPTRRVAPEDLRPGDVVTFVHPTADRPLRGEASVSQVDPDGVVAVTLGDGDLVPGQTVHFDYRDLVSARRPGPPIRPQQYPSPERLKALRPGDLIGLRDDDSVLWVTVQHAAHDGVYAVMDGRDGFVPSWAIHAVEAKDR